jgi:hypothetical protein
MQLVVVRNNDLKPPTIRKRARSQKSVLTTIIGREDKIKRDDPGVDEQKPFLATDTKEEDLDFKEVNTGAKDQQVYRGADGLENFYPTAQGNKNNENPVYPQTQGNTPKQNNSGADLNEANYQGNQVASLNGQNLTRESLQESQDEKVGRGLRKIQSMAIQKRDKFSMTSSGSSVKLRKLIVTTDNGTSILNVNLKSWDVRR